MSPAPPPPPPNTHTPNVRLCRTPACLQTSQHCVYFQEIGFSFVEFNASDSRSKKTLEQHISELLDNRTMDGYFRTAGLNKAGFPHGNFFSREQAKSECDWLVMSSVFLAGQSSCFFLCSREQIRQVENRLNTLSNS